VTRRTLAVLWLVVGVLLWNGIFDLYIGRGVREYLHLRAEFELGVGPEPSMAAVMARAQRRGAAAASIWAAGVAACGWLTIVLASRSRAPVDRARRPADGGGHP
jgi:hypothetical protein